MFNAEYDEDELQSGRESEDVEVNRNLFKDQHGFRIAFFLHKSIKKEFSRQNLTQDIEKHGGTVLDTDNGCETVLVDATYGEKETLQIAYNTDDNRRFRKVFVENASFVQHCIRCNHFVHRIPAQKGMGGAVGRGRVPFTADDDESLCHYLARVIPDKAAGGRSGLEVYKQLVRTASVRSTHTWGARHTTESWKERYKKNAATFDEWIEDIVKQEGRSRKQLWREDRRVTHKALRAKQNDESEAESSEENYELEERSPPPRKRQRSDYSPPNRRPIVRYSSDQQARTHSSSSGKGKARALEEEEEEEEDSHEIDQIGDYADPSEPGPSKSRSFLQATNNVVDGLTHRTQANTASFFTQETIIASVPSKKSAQSKETSPLPDVAMGSSPLVRRSKQVIRKSRQASPSEYDEPIAAIDLTSSSGYDEPIAVIDLTSPSGSIGRNSPDIQLSPTRTFVNPTHTQAARPPDYQPPLKGARRPRAMIRAPAPVVDAPYRNTRSRSRSVEPAPKSPVLRSKSRRNMETQKTNALATVDETQDDDRQDNDNLEMADEPIMPPLGEEILADEMDVENMLVSDDFNRDEELAGADDVSEVSLDTDDAQTEQNLRPTQLPRPVQHPQQPFTSLQTHPSDILKEFNESSEWMSRYSGLSTARPHHLNKPVVPVRNVQEKPGSILPPYLGNLPDNGAAEPPRTPLRRLRKNSVSSMDYFPVSGTKASALKKKLEQQEKRNPYRPPGGTRAAKFARSRK